MRWVLHSISRPAVRPLRLRPGVKRLSTNTASTPDEKIGRVSVPVGSSGSVDIDLHNLAKINSSEPLLIYLPPFVTITKVPNDRTRLPEFCEGRATAVIHYGWREPLVEGNKPIEDSDWAREKAFLRLHPGWPTPLYDTLEAYTWIVRNLAPPDHQRRDIYVYGSYLSASLAISIALTETYPRKAMAVRGCIAHNGIYDWTMFLPGHPINEKPQSRSGDILEETPVLPESKAFLEMSRMTKSLFKKPSNLFDPFASPCLFFQTPPLSIPPSFNKPTESPNQPQKGWLTFPPTYSTLRIPKTLLLHDTPSSFPSPVKRKQKKGSRNNFQVQAEELAHHMRNSVVRFQHDVGLRCMGDPEDLDEEVDEWIQVHDVGLDNGEGIVAEWLEDRTQTPSELRSNQ